MRRILQPLKFITIFFLIAWFFIFNGTIAVFVWDGWRRTLIWSRVLTTLSGWTCNLLGLRVEARGTEHLAAGNALIAGNHLSYLDVVAIASKVTTCFVTSVEIRETPFLGQLCAMAGCLFVERRNRMQILSEISELKDGLGRGLNVVIFPEATSTNGEKLLRFRRPLFESARQSGKPVIPMCLNYRRVNSDPVSLANRDTIFWYGSMPFASHLWAICGLKSIHVDLIFAAPIQTVGVADSTELAERTQATVESVFLPVAQKASEQA